MRRVMVAAALLLGLATSAGAEETDLPAWAAALRLRGRLAEEFAYRLHDPGDVSKLKTLGWLDGKYTFSDAVAVRAAVRGWYDAVFDATDRYPANVERDQKTDVSLREALLTVGHGDFDARIGRQQIVWGEAISVFVTDIVNPKDFREFVLPDFSELRIPIWALDASYRLAEGLRLETVWTPDTMSNRLPKQGAEFQFARPRFRFRNPVVRLPDNQDEFSLERSEGGVRLSVLQRGWDVSLIYYDQADKTPVFFQRRVSQPAGPDIVVIEPRHPRLHIVGATLGKSFEPVVVRAEAALSIGKRYETTDPLDPDGVVRRDTLDWLVGVDYTLFERVDTSLQLSQKVLMGSATNLTRPGVAAPVTTSVALRVTTGFFDNTLNPTLLFVVGVNRGDFRLSPRIDYLVSQAVTLSLGADLFEGPRLTLYGQFDRNDRVTLTTTWRF
ncbi:MAG TPA: DUF1302 family protein [Methylomirabilota bacterium]